MINCKICNKEIKEHDNFDKVILSLEPITYYFHKNCGYTIIKNWLELTRILK